jgi:hypothetical protein
MWVLDLLRHVLTATLGTAIVGDEISQIYHTKTLTGSVVKQIIISAIVASLLGALSQHVRPSNLAGWMWLPGVVAFFAWTLPTQPTSALDGGGGFKLDLSLDIRDPMKITMWFVAVRLVGYSLGAICYSMVAAKSRR